MDYAGQGKNKLLSSQTLHFDPAEPGRVKRVDVVTYGYGDADPQNEDDITQKLEKRYAPAAGGDWFLAFDGMTQYAYYRG